MLPPQPLIFPSFLGGGGFATPFQDALHPDELPTPTRSEKLEPESSESQEEPSWELLSESSSELLEESKEVRVRPLLECLLELVRLEEPRVQELVLQLEPEEKESSSERWTSRSPSLSLASSSPLQLPEKLVEPLESLELLPVKELSKLLEKQPHESVLPVQESQTKGPMVGPSIYHYFKS